MRLIVIAGKDIYQVAARTKEVIEVFRAAHGEIERFDFDGETVEIATLLDELRSYGLIQQYKLVVLDKADAFLAREGYRALMEKYAANPVDSATLLMRGETWRRGRIDALIEKVGVIAKAEPPTASRAVAWCQRRVEKEYDATIEPEAASQLVELTGPDLARLDSELAKLAAFVSGERVITRQDVANLVGMSREDQVWSLQQPVAAGRADEAMRKFYELMSLARQPESTRTLITWAMCDLVRKVHAASQLLRQGVNPGAISKQLKLWGESQRAILNAARRLEPEVPAELLDMAIRTDLQSKSGLGNATRSLEVMTMRIADMMSER